MRVYSLRMAVRCQLRHCVSNESSVRRKLFLQDITPLRPVLVLLSSRCASLGHGLRLLLCVPLSRTRWLRHEPAAVRPQSVLGRLWLMATRAGSQRVVDGRNDGIRQQSLVLEGDCSLERGRTPACPEGQAGGFCISWGGIMGRSHGGAGNGPQFGASQKGNFGGPPTSGGRVGAAGQACVENSAGGGKVSRW